MDRTHVGDSRGANQINSTDGNKREKEKEEGGHVPMPMAIRWVEGKDWTPGLQAWGRGSGSDGPECNLPTESRQLNSD